MKFKKRTNMKFKVGDRVVFTGKINHNYFRNLKGTIIIIDDRPLPICVEFDENVGGHHGGYDLEHRGKSGHCWRVKPRKIKLVNHEKL